MLKKSIVGVILIAFLVSLSGCMRTYLLVSKPKADLAFTKLPESNITVKKVSGTYSALPLKSVNPRCNVAFMLERDSIEGNFQIESQCDIGECNGFIASFNKGNHCFVSARHCMRFTHKTIKSRAKMHGLDICSLEIDTSISSNFRYLKEKTFFKKYSVSIMKEQEDSLFTKGYLCNDAGKFEEIKISGLGRKLWSNKLAYIRIKTANPLEMRGLSGSPVCNKYGEAVGLLKGATIVENTDICIFVISLFKEETQTKK